MPGTGDLWFTIVNLHAGSGKTVSIWRKAEILLAKAGIPYDNKYTDCKYHATEIAFQAASEGYRKFIAVGGDGTIHEVLEGIMKYVCGTESVSVSDFSIAVIPIGSGNDWIRIHGINRNLERTIELIRNESLVRQDVVRVSVFDPVAEPEQLLSAEPVRTSYMVNIGGVGFDARVCERVNEQKLEGKKGKRMSDYEEEFDYLVSSGVSLEVKAISVPTYPLVENSGKNLLKLYLNDVGLLTALYYKNNIQAILQDLPSVNLGSVYETVVAQELAAHGCKLYYYDNKKNGEVDFLVDDADSLSVLPLEIKSGKDYTVHSALDKFLAVKDYNIKQAFVLSNESKVVQKGGITYMPVYYVMFVGGDA